MKRLILKWLGVPVRVVAREPMSPDDRARALQQWAADNRQRQAVEEVLWEQMTAATDALANPELAADRRAFMSGVLCALQEFHGELQRHLPAQTKASDEPQQTD